MAITFAVSDVAAEPARKPALAWQPSLTSLVKKKVEQLSPPSTSPLVSATTEHALAKAAHDAFYGHHPLVLTPDAVWFTLAQGFAQHMSLHSEALRKRFVRHEGKLRLVVERPDFALGKDNPWPEAFAGFSQQIAGHVGKLRELLVCDFSTTTPVSKAASEVLVMDAFQGYFEYVMLMGCGIPSITLTGTVDDWRSVRRRAAMLSEFGLQRWTDVLLPLLDRVVDTAAGAVDVEFWRSFFHYRSGSGPSEMTGWFNAFFPYLDDRKSPGKLVVNPHYAKWQQGLSAKDTRTSFIEFATQPRGPTLKALPSSLASAPVVAIDVRTGASVDLRFVAGLVGVVQDVDDGALQPEFGWAVVYD